MNEVTATSAGALAFRAKLLLAMMLVIAGVTGLSLYLAQRALATEAQREIERDFDTELARHETAQESRHAALAERTRALVRRPRIHAALEDNALDLLYPSASDELRDLPGPGRRGEARAGAVRIARPFLPISRCAGRRHPTAFASRSRPPFRR